MSDDGSFYLHCDWHRVQYLRCILDEVFGNQNIVNEIIWCYEDIGSKAVPYFKRKHDSILFYQKSDKRIFNILRKKLSESTIKRFGTYFNKEGKITYRWLKENNPGVFKKLKGIPDNLDEAWLDINKGQPYPDWWIGISPLKSHFQESVKYPTQKPENLIERLIKASSDPGDIVFDGFMGSGSVQAIAMKLGRRFIGADINAGAIQTTIKRLINTADELKSKSDKKYYIGFSVYNVNQYDIFRNELEAKDLIIKALEIEPLNSGSIFDGTKDEYKVKIMPINCIATRADISKLVNNLDYKGYERIKSENLLKTVDNIMLVCMGHEPELMAHFKKETEKYRINLKVYDILRDGSHLTFKYDSEANIEIKNNILEIKQFYPTMLLEKLRKQNETVTEYRELVESVMIDPYYDDAVFTPTIKDIPAKHEIVKGKYELPADHGRVAIKITDLLSETFFTEVTND